MRIDVHAHYWPTTYLDLFERFGNSDTSSMRRLPATEKPDDMTARFKMMDDAGVDIQILSASPLMPYFKQRSNAVAAALHINNAYAAIVQKYPDRLRALASPPLSFVDEALSETRRCLDELGMVGV